MKRYIVSFTTNTSICIRHLPALKDTKEPKIFSTELHFTNQEIVIQIYDNVAQYNSFTGRDGLRIDVALDSAAIISSVDKAGGYADAMLSFLVLCTSSYAPVVKFDFAYEITPGIDKHEYMRDFYLEDIQFLIQRKAEPNIYGEIFNAAAEHEDRMQHITTRGEWHKYAGLQRAVSWFRKGIGADDIIDEYICYWIALEALGHLLTRDISEPLRVKCAECGYSFDTCPNCGKNPRIFASTSPLYEIEKLALDTGLSKKEFSELRRLRAKILHSGSALRVIRKQEDTPLVESIRTKVPVLRNLLIDGLSKALKLSKETIQQIKEHEPLKERQAIRLRLKTYIEDVDSATVSEMGYPTYPSIEAISHKLNKIELSPNGKFVDPTASVTLKLVNCRIPAHTNIETEMWSNVPAVAGKGKLSVEVQKHDS